MKDSFFVKNDKFEGPLDLLLSLIEKRKLLINEISLAKITDDYIEFVNREEDVTLRNRAHFILVAATLVLIKSKSLLPNLELNEEEQDSIEELETRLKVFQKIKEAEPWISEKFGQKISHYPLQRKQTVVSFSPAKNISSDSLFQGIKSVINSFPKTNTIPHKTVKRIISLEESILRLGNQIKQKVSLSFQSFSNIGKSEKINVVVNFLAMLELIKQGMIQVSQSEHYADIEMQTNDIETPDYS